MYEATRELTETQDAFWNHSDRVAQFAARDVDLRLKALYEKGAVTGRILDLGCAAGRNTVWLAAQGVDVLALDSSDAMVEQCRQSVQQLWSEDERKRRVITGRMEDLSPFTDDEFSGIVALGIYQQAESEDSWARCLAESARVLKPGGFCLVANFAPGTGPVEAPPQKIEGTRFLYPFRSGTVCLFEAAELDEEFKRAGFDIVEPSQTVDRVANDSRRRTVNALYRRG